MPIVFHCIPVDVGLINEFYPIIIIYINIEVKQGFIGLKLYNTNCYILSTLIILFQ